MQVDISVSDSRSSVTVPVDASSKSSRQSNGQRSQRLGAQLHAHVEMKSLVLTLVPNAAAITSRVLSR